jgi:hypothetical protein
MKKIIFLFLVLGIQAIRLYANEIDDLKTVEEVNKFLRKNILTRESKGFLKKSKPDNEQFGKNKFHKIDLDQNGLTDLVIDSDFSFAVVDKGSGKYGFHPIDRGFVNEQKYTLTNIENKNDLPLLVLRRYDQKNGRVAGKETEKTLVFKFDEFIEFNPNPDDLKIEEIKISALGCVGNCPVYQMTMLPDKITIFNAVKNLKKKGQFKTTIDAENYERIIQTINYIGITKLVDNYITDKMDLPVINLEIKFNNGKVKRLSSYEMDSHFGLENLFTRLYALPENQRWTN